MTAEQAILSLGTVTLATCGAGLLLIHGSNPLLKGLNWMGGALLIGGVATGLTLAGAHASALSPLANFCILLTFVFAFRADRYISDLDITVSPWSVALVCCQCATAACQWSHLLDDYAAAGLTSLLAAMQMAIAALTIQRNATGKLRVAARFAVWFMSLLALANALRASCGAVGLAMHAAWTASLNLMADSLFVGSAICLAFIFFWRTTTKLSVDLEYMASTDPLTRVYNRRVFLSWCESEQARSQRLHTPFSLLMVDFDHFKSVNDRFGHHVGDRARNPECAPRPHTVRGLDVLCRWGGEEFCVLLPNASEEATLIVAERVRRNVRLVHSSNPQFAEDAFPDLQLSASIGTATYEGDEDTYQQMLQRADTALYEAKHGGRNRVVRSGRTRGAELTQPQLVLEAS